MEHLELQEPHPPFHQRPPKNGNPRSHQNKSLPTLQQRNLRTPHKMTITIKNKNTLLSQPVRQRLSWLGAASRSHQSPQINTNRTNNLLDVYQLLISRINSTHLIPSLTTFDQSPTLRTISGTDKTCSIFIEREYDPFLYKYPYHDSNLEIVWKFS